MKKILKIIWSFVRPTLLGDDKQPSGKRILGTQLIETGKVLTIIAMIFYFIKPTISLGDITVLISPLFLTGTAFWGITSMQSYYTSKNIPSSKEEAKSEKENQP